MEEKQLTEHESLQLIQQMIHTAKKEQKDDGKGWIVWGWMLFAASVLTVLNQRFAWFSTFFFWNAFGLFTIASMIFGLVMRLFRKKAVKVKTYTGDLFSKLNTGFFISIFFIILTINLGASVVSNRYGRFDNTFIIMGFALLINLYAFWILIYGTALNFRPSVIGAYLTWAVGFGALFVKTFEQVMLLHALAVLIGYIIPGHIANREFRQYKRQDKAVPGV